MKATNEPLRDAYRPTAETKDEDHVPPSRGKSALPAIGFFVSLFGLLAPAILAGLSILGVIHVAWDSILIPGIALFVCVPISVCGVIVSIIACVLHRSWLAGAGILLGALATLASLAATWLLAMIGLASHPV